MAQFKILKGDHTTTIPGTTQQVTVTVTQTPGSTQTFQTGQIITTTNPNEIAMMRASPSKFQEQ